MKGERKLIRVALVGGPKSGKSSMMDGAAEEFHEDEVLFMPEVATMLRKGGYPMPDERFPLSDQWQEGFQDAVFYTQRAKEMEYERRASVTGARILVLDRALWCGAAYFPGKEAEFCARYHVTKPEMYDREDFIVEVESLSTASRKDFLYRGAGRMEDIDRAQHIELATQEIWQDHLHRIAIMGMVGVASKTDRLIGLLHGLLAF